MGPPITVWEKEQAQIWVRKTYPKIQAHQRCQRDQQMHQELCIPGQEKWCATYAHWSEITEGQPAFAMQGFVTDELFRPAAQRGQPSRFEAWRWTTTKHRLEQMQATEEATSKQVLQLRQFWDAALEHAQFRGGHGVYHARTRWERLTHEAWARQFTEVVSQGWRYSWENWSQMTRKKPIDRLQYARTPTALPQQDPPRPE
jgi:hypothetical protein